MRFIFITTIALALACNGYSRKIDLSKFDHKVGFITGIVNEAINESCYSDTQIVYEMYGAEDYKIKLEIPELISMKMSEFYREKTSKFNPYYLKFHAFKGAVAAPRFSEFLENKVSDIREKYCNSIKEASDKYLLEDVSLEIKEEVDRFANKRIKLKKFQNKLKKLTDEIQTQIYAE